MHHDHHITTMAELPASAMQHSALPTTAAYKESRHNHRMASIWQANVNGKKGDPRRRTMLPIVDVCLVKSLADIHW